MHTPTTISIIGTGNVATHLFKALSQHAILPPDSSIRIINSRTLNNLPDHSDLILISVKDDAIGSVAQRVTGKADMIAHTSGSVSIDILRDCAKHYGVFYPLQTFSKNSELNYLEIPFFIEGNDAETIDNLKTIAQSISPKVFEADSSKRKRLHIAAVFACNFSNHLVAIADDLLQEDGMDYKVLLPLLKETVRKLDTLPPKDAQTGPAVRNDQKVISSHEDMLADHPDRLAIYRLLSSSILSSLQ